MTTDGRFDPFSIVNPVAFTREAIGTSALKACRQIAAVVSRDVSPLK